MVIQVSDTFFPEKNTKPVPGFNILTLLRHKKFEGEIGIEIEVEGNKFPKHAFDGYDPVDPDRIPDQWQYHKDGSLRGEDNAEYVTSGPMKFTDMPKAIDDLWMMFKEYGTELDKSNRTSVHVHLNMQQFHLNRLAAFAALYLSVEEILTAWCGEHRVGNLFCLRAKDAPAIVTLLKKFIITDGQTKLSDGLHYAGLNAQALAKFGSMEIRSLRGCRNPETIKQWVSILERIYNLSAEFPDPRKICDNFSGHGPLEYLYFVVGDKINIIKDKINLDNQQIMESLYNGIRLAQDLCYCRDWNMYVPMEMDPDPFNRDAKKVASHMMEMQDMAVMDELANAASMNANPYIAMTSPAPYPPPLTNHWVTAEWVLDPASGAVISAPPSPVTPEEESEGPPPPQDWWLHDYNEYEDNDI